MLLSLVLLVTGCATQSPASSTGRTLRQSQRGASLLESSRDGLADDVSPHQSDTPERLQRHRENDAEAIADGQQRAAETRQAVTEATDDVKGSIAGLARDIPKLAAHARAIHAHGDLFARYFDFGVNQVLWLGGSLRGAAMLVEVADSVDDPDMAVGVLRMTGPRLQAAMAGVMLLASWFDFLQLADTVLQQCPYYSVEQLLVDMERVQKRLEPAMTALSSLEPGRVEATAAAMPELMGQLTQEFHTIREGARMAMERTGQVIAAAQFIEMVGLVSTLRVSLPRLPPAGPVLLGARLVVSPGGVMAGSHLVVSAEWVEMMRRLVQAGVISMPVASAAVRIHAGQVLMAQSHRDLPKGVREALGDSPEVRGMHETGKAGAGMSEAPKHHVLPREHRKWFEQRGFTGAMDIDQFCVRMEKSHHEAVHGGGDWRLGRAWPGEWNQLLMRELLKAEARAGRKLTRDAILKLVAKHMKDYKLPMNFTSWRGQ
ncbi:DUF2380 domain-containing protein [Myxococcus qinghaiensis]|uniref:DUF2380 domain-containing protein n=1 Tax=Myxococcus qinghaiensis TaxID=2906758 RepID=UPI0020A82E8B|nr:DUF2380 domain-containing protein [Myxococcus qinghaiensis]MCP3164716.1 DUF2380 domain-containing protein [Myxococcus qinghaiensis]